MGRTLGAVAHRALDMDGGGMILGIETAVERVGVALGDGSGILASARLASDRRHAESLTPMIAFVLEQAGVQVSDLSAIAVDVGPGLFTGMRVGIAAAEAMAWALEIPLVGVCSLDALALEAARGTETVAVALDARRSEVYWALYRPTGTGGEPVRITEPCVSGPDDLAVLLADRAEDVTCAGSGFIRHADSLEAAWTHHTGLTGPSAEAVVAIGAHRVAIDATVPAGGLEPMYLRAPDAEINWRTRRESR